MPEAFIIDAVRTPIGKRGGGLSEAHSADLGAHVLKALVDRTGVDAGASLAVGRPAIAIHCARVWYSASASATTISSTTHHIMPDLRGFSLSNALSLTAALTCFEFRLCVPSANADNRILSAMMLMRRNRPSECASIFFATLLLISSGPV